MELPQVNKSLEKELMQGYTPAGVSLRSLQLSVDRSDLGCRHRACMSLKHALGRAPNWISNTELSH